MKLYLRCLKGFAVGLCMSLPFGQVQAKPPANPTAPKAGAPPASAGHKTHSSSKDAKPEDGSKGADTSDALTEAEKKALDKALGEDNAARGKSDTGSAASAPVQTVPPGANAMNPAIALILDTALAWFSIDDVSQMQGGAHDPSRTGFTFQQLEMHVSASVDPYFSLTANLVFSQFGVEIEEAFAKSLGLPGGLQLRAGQFLSRFGRVNPTHPHAWAFSDQPIALSRFFGGEGNRGLGAEVSWLAPTPWMLELIASVQMPEGECCTRSNLGGLAFEVNGPEDLLYTVALKQFYDLGPDWGLSWGLSAQFGPASTGLGNRSEIYGTDLYLRYRPVSNPDRMALSLHFEFFLRGRQFPGTSRIDYATLTQLIYTIDPRWEVGLRHEYLLALEDDPLDPEQEGDRHRTSAQVTFRPSHFSRVRLQGNWDRADWRQPRDAFGVILAVEFLIGAHGSHDY